MEITHAHWEQRNLGVRSYEIKLSAKDTMEDFLLSERQLRDEGAEHIVVKAPVNTAEFLVGLPQAGYLFMEASVALSLRKSKYSCPAYIARFDRNIAVKAIDHTDDCQRIYDEIAKGIFNSDRITLDRTFSQEAASRRYINWMKDLRESGESIHEVCLGRDAIGFFIFKRIDARKARGILTGLYEEYAASGYGSVIMKKLCDTVWDQGYKTYYAAVTSNNLKALRANISFGSEIDGISYHYVKNVQSIGEGGGA